MPIDVLLLIASVPEWAMWLAVAIGAAALAYMIWAWR
jgi:hypothetical protein